MNPLGFTSRAWMRFRLCNEKFAPLATPRYRRNRLTNADGRWPHDWMLWPYAMSIEASLNHKDATP